MKVLVTGGVGFLGSHLCERLLDDGHEVTSLDDVSTGQYPNIEKLALRPGFSFFEGSINRAKMLNLDELDWIMNLASPASPVAYGTMPIHTLRTGSVGTMALLDLAVHHGARFLQASTSEVYGDPLVHPQPETYWGNVNPIGWRSCYDEAKRFSEAAVMAYRYEFGVDVRLPRIFNTYGPRMRLDDGRPVVTFALAALKGRPLPVQGDGTQTRSFCFVSDMVEALVRLMESDYTGPINLGSTHEITILELAELVLEVSGSQRSKIEFVDRVEDDPEQRRPDTTLAKEVLDWEPKVFLDEGIEHVIEYVQEQINVQEGGS